MAINDLDAQLLLNSLLVKALAAGEHTQRRLTVLIRVVGLKSGKLIKQGLYQQRYDVS